MIFRPFHRFESGCASYAFGCGTIGVCAVVDPLAGDVDAYAEFAAAKGMRITHVIDTHVHADHVSGGRRLADRSGAAYCLHRSADVAFPFQPLEDGEVIELGNTQIRVLHTPGHTPESVCLLVTDLRRGPEPWFLTTGDTLFVGAVGRPDLPGRIRESAEDLHRSLTRRILPLEDALEIYPGHFAGSACGAGMSGKPMTTLGFEKRWNPWLRMRREEFIESILRDVPPKPTTMEETVRVNQGRGE